MTRCPRSVAVLALSGTILMTLGLYFAWLRPPLLPEDPRFMGFGAVAQLSFAWLALPLLAILILLLLYPAW